MTDEEISFADSESDEFDSSSSVLTVGGKTKKFVGKLLSGPDEEDFEISFLQRSNKIKNGFVFPDQEDLASISKQDIDRILPPPCPVA